MKRALGIAGMSAVIALAACGGSVSLVGDGGDEGTDAGGGGGGSGSSSGGTTSSGAGSTSGGSSGSGGTSSGSASSSGGTGSSSGSGSSSGGPGPGPGPCPSTAPTRGSPCTNVTVGLTCEYGGSAVQGCDTVATCNTQQGVWTVQAPTLVDCGSLTPTCPAGYASVPRGAACTNNGAICDYDQGRCECTSGGGPVRLIDGSPGTSWFCQDPGTAGCPARRPPLGSKCTGNLTCDYGTCSVEGGTAEACVSGTWYPAFVGCPL